jgi:hypothetical protein
MNKLKLVLCIATSPDDIVVSSGIRIFDLKSMEAAALAIRSGALGRHSKARYFVQGEYNSPLGVEVIDCVPFLFLISFKTRGDQSKPQHRWVINPRLRKLLADISK